MDPQELAKMTTILTHINDSKSSQAFADDIWFEFVAVNQNNVSNDVASALQQFEEVSNINIAKNERPALVVSKRRTSTSDDVNVSVASSNISVRKREKSSVGDASSGEPSFSGSPLKIQTFADLSAFASPMTTLSVSHTNVSPKKIFVGLDLQDARYLVSLYTISCKKILGNDKKSTVKAIPSIWVLCNTHNRLPLSSTAQKIVILGAEPVPKSKDVHHPRLKLIKVMTASKPVDSVDTLLFPFSKTMSDIVCQAKYDLIENQKVLDDGYMVLKVLLEWKKASRLLENFPPEATATVFANVTSGHAQSPAHNLYMELTVLKNVCCAISSGDIIWVNSSQNESLIELVRNLVQRVHETDTLDTVDDTDTDTDNTDKPCTTHFNLDSRHDTDFTDELWKILVKCNSLSELVESLQYVFTSLKNGDIQPALHERNQTMMADLVRDSYRNKMVVPALKGILPLTIMAEIGTEKLLWDYVTFFVSSGLVPQVSLAYYMKQGLETQAKIERLEKLHNILEMVMMFKVFLPLPLHVMSQIVKKMLLHFENNSAPKDYLYLKDHLDVKDNPELKENLGHKDSLVLKDDLNTNNNFQQNFKENLVLKDKEDLKDKQILENQLFKFPVPATAVQSFLGSKKPSVWKAESVNPDTSESKLCYLSTTRPFQQLQGGEEEVVDTEGEGDGDSQAKRPKYYMVVKQESIV